MDFSKVENIFSAWADESGLSIQVEYKNEEVRATEIFGPNQDRWQLWLTPINESDECVIHYWNYKDISLESRTDNQSLLLKLTEIGDIIQSGNVRNT